MVLLSFLLIFRVHHKCRCEKKRKDNAQVICNVGPVLVGNWKDGIYILVYSGHHL